MPIVCVFFLIINMSIEFYSSIANEESGGFNFLIFILIYLPS